jgi:pyrroloquinoline quinone biosynthesis protein D
MSDLDLQSKPALAPRARLQVDPVSGGAVLLYPEGLLELSETAYALLKQCDGKATVCAIISSLAEEFEAPHNLIAADVQDCLRQLSERRLIVFAP